jgi:hypothetical protein
MARGGNTNAFAINPGKVSATAGYAAHLRPGTTGWTCTKSGVYRFVLKGPGGKGIPLVGGLTGAGRGGGSGAHNEASGFLNAGQRVVCAIGAGSTETDTSIALPGRSMAVVAGAGCNGDNVSTPSAGGVASGGDYMLAGSAGGNVDAAGVAGLGPGGAAGGLGAGLGSHGSGGGGAPGTLDFPGGKGASTQSNPPSADFPGAGGACDENGSGYHDGQGGDGAIFVMRVR